MKKITAIEEVRQFLEEQKRKGLQIGFVPTMGALHEGHVELIKQAKRENDLVVCSIFVNPLQFNRKEDLKNYPIRIEEDSVMLEAANCDLLFTPEVETLYANQVEDDFDFGSLGKGMEADYRPGHFKGVAAVIERFFAVLNPDRAYFGEKDFQQLAIVKWVKKHFGFDTEIVGCKTVRYENGLAMSSRNYLMKKEDFQTAAKIYECMQYCKKMLGKIPPETLAKECFQELQKEFKPEYVEIVDEESLAPITNWSAAKRSRVFVAAYLSDVRLIDNISLND